MGERGGGGVGGEGVVFRCTPYLEGSATWLFKKVVETSFRKVLECGTTPPPINALIFQAISGVFKMLICSNVIICVLT